MRRLVFVSLIAGAVFAAPAAYAGVGVAAEANQNHWYATAADDALAAMTRRPAERNGLVGAQASFGFADDSTAVEQAKGAEAIVAVGSPLRRSVMAQAKKDEVATLPEPATWVMLLFGFGAMGTALRWKLRRLDERFTAKIRRIEAGEHG